MYICRVELFGRRHLLLLRVSCSFRSNHQAISQVFKICIDYEQRKYLLVVVSELHDILSLLTHFNIRWLSFHTFTIILVLFKEVFSFVNHEYTE